MIIKKKNNIIFLFDIHIDNIYIYIYIFDSNYIHLLLFHRHRVATWPYHMHMHIQIASDYTNYLIHDCIHFPLHNMLTGTAPATHDL